MMLTYCIAQTYWPHALEYIKRTAELWNKWIRLSCYYNWVYISCPL